MSEEKRRKIGGHKNKGAWKGRNADKRHAPFKSGDAIQAMGKEAIKKKWARIRSLREAITTIRDMKTDEDTGETNGIRATLAIFEKAKDGDPRAYELLAKITGEMEQTITVKEITKLVDDI